jgi:hypothetical protein
MSESENVGEALSGASHAHDGTYERVGEVTAVRMPHAWRWRTPGGDELLASAGDWMVRDEEGNSWSVADDIFRETYRHRKEDRWVRVGQVHARCATQGEAVKTIEGLANARIGDWVISGARGERWVVGTHEFQKTYRWVDGS